jgi:hypothetical protein
VSLPQARLASSTFKAALIANVYPMNIFLPCFRVSVGTSAGALADGSWLHVLFGAQPNAEKNFPARIWNALL